MVEVEGICETFFDTIDMADRPRRLEILTHEECVPPCGLVEVCFHFGGA